MKFLATGAAGCIGSIMVAHSFRVDRELSVLAPLLKEQRETIFYNSIA